MTRLEDENAALMSAVVVLRSDLEQARAHVAALEQALDAQRPALDEAHAKITKYRLEIVGLLDKLARVG